MANHQRPVSKTRKAASVKLPSEGKARILKALPEESRDARYADIAAAADTTAALVVTEFSKLSLGDVSLEDMVGVLDAKVKAVQCDDLRDAEALLTAQAVGLNSIYTGLVLIARKNLTDHFDMAERLMRLGLKAQGQCRATLETLAMIKNPPTVFARQANIAHGPQQVNNTAVLPSPTGNPATRARAAESESEPNKLLEAHGERLDLGTTGAAGTGDQALAAVGTVKRPA